MTTTIEPAEAADPVGDPHVVSHPLYGTDLPSKPIGDVPVERALVRAHTIAGLFGLLAAAVFGLLVATKFTAPEFLTDSAVTGWGRLRFAHVQGILFAWLINGFIAFAYYAVPTMSGRAVLSRKLGWWLFWTWNFGVVLLGWFFVLVGYSQSVEWGEFPIVIDVVTLVVFAGFAAQFIAAYLRAPRARLYVSSWYLLLAFTFTPGAFIIGQLLPEYFAPGALGALLSGLWIHDAVGLLVTPMALAIAYYVVPVVTGRPIFSHFMSLVGFWGLVLFYPLNGVHHYVFSPIPMGAQKVAIMASIFMGLVVLIVVTNLFVSMRGCAKLAAANLSLRFVWVAIIFYLLVSLQGAFQAGLSVQEQIHFSDWVIGHSHLAMAGFATFMIFGGILHTWPRVSGRAFHARYANQAFWVGSIALMTMVTDLTIAGLLQAGSWMNADPWIDSVVLSKTPWLVRTISGGFLAAAFVLLIMALLKKPGPENSEDDPPALHEIDHAPTEHVLEVDR